MDETQRYYRKAYDLYEKAYMRYRENIGSKMWFAEESLLVEKAEQAFALADDVVKRQLFSPEDRLAMRFIVVISLRYQQKRAETLTELQTLIAYYRSLIAYNEKYWEYEALKNVISMSQKLSDADKTLLLKLIDILEAPKPEGDQKLKELEAQLPEMLK
jgi:streptomycin 6-kinase